MTISAVDTAERVLAGMVTALREDVGSGVAAIDSYVSTIAAGASMALATFGVSDASDAQAKVYIGEDPALTVGWPNIGLRLLDVSPTPDEVGGFYELVEEYELLIGVREDCGASTTVLNTPQRVYQALLIYAQAAANLLQDRLREDLKSDGVGRCDWIGTTPITEGFGQVLNYGEAWTVRFASVRLRVQRTYVMGEA